MPCRCWPIHAYNQVAHNLRERWVEVAFDGWVNSTYEPIDRQAYDVWARYNWWMVPWWDQVGDFHFDSESGPSSNDDGGDDNSTYYSWTSTLSSSVV